MKSTYIIPIIEITKIESVQMMCLSIVSGGSADDSDVLSKKRQETDDEFVNGNDWNVVIGSRNDDNVK